MCRMILLVSAALFLTAAMAPVHGDKDKTNKIPDAVVAVLEKADKWELFALDPVIVKGKEDKKDKGKDDKAETRFHGWKVIGKTEVKDAETRTMLLASLKKGVAANKGEFALCFNPRHAIRATVEGKTVDLVICFECLRARSVVDGKMTEFLLTNAPQAAFDTVLVDAKVIPRE